MDVMWYQFLSNLMSGKHKKNSENQDTTPYKNIELIITIRCLFS